MTDSLKPTSPGAFSSCSYDWDWRGAENSIRRALELDPNNLDAHYHYSLVLLMAAGTFRRKPSLKSKRPNNWTHSLTRFKYTLEEFFSTPGNSMRHCGV